MYVKDNQQPTPTRSLRHLLIPALVAASLASVLTAQTTTMLTPADITYVGAFRIQDPPAGGAQYATWNYSNAPIAYYPAGDAAGPADGYTGSLFMAGHVYESRLAEIEIPVPVASKTLSSLPTARITQPMTNVAGSISNKSGFIMGMTYVPTQGRVFFTYSQDYSDSDCQLPGSPPGLGSFRPTLSNPQVNGLWYLSKGSQAMHPFQSLRYIMNAPQTWADSRLGGRSIVTGRYRGWCPEGPNTYASAPWSAGSPPAPGVSVPSSTVMEYGAYGDTAKYPVGHGHASAYRGAVWLTAGTKSSAIISGIIDYDPARGYYGYDNWKSPNECDPDPAANGCTGQRGWHAADPRPALLFVNPDDMAAVAAGTKSSWTVQWYARLDIESYMLRRYDPTFLATGTTAEAIIPTYDSARGLLYISESYADGLKPVIHVFRVRMDGQTITAPSAPTNVRIVR